MDLLVSRSSRLKAGWAPLIVGLFVMASVGAVFAQPGTGPAGPGSMSEDAAAPSLDGTASLPTVAPVPSPAEWVAAARSGTPLQVTLAGAPVRLSVEPNDGLFAPGFAVHDLDGAPVDHSGIHPLKGHVDGAPDSHLRITVFEETVMGYVEAREHGRFVVGPLMEGGNGVIRAGQSLPDLRYHDESVHDHTDDALDKSDFSCLHPLPLPLAAPTGLVTGWSARTFDNAVAVDQEFVDHYGGDWAAVATGFMNAGDGFYETQIDMGLSMVDLHAHTLSGGDTGALLGSVRNHYQASHSGLARENVQYFTGKTLSGAVGQANCIGGAGTTSIAYTVSLAANFDPIDLFGFQVYADGYVKILVHELGHILSAHHHYANCAEAAPYFQPSQPSEVCTLMINYVDFPVFTLSTANKLSTRGWADSAGL